MSSTLTEQPATVHARHLTGMQKLSLQTHSLARPAPRVVYCFFSFQAIFFAAIKLGPRIPGVYAGGPRLATEHSRTRFQPISVQPGSPISSSPSRRIVHSFPGRFTWRSRWLRTGRAAFTGVCWYLRSLEPHRADELLLGLDDNERLAIAAVGKAPWNCTLYFIANTLNCRGPV